MATLRTVDSQDARMEESINRKLQEKGNSSWIQIIARDGYINLFGFVDAFKDKTEISEIVQSFPGVRVVTNHIRVKLLEDKREVAHF